MKKIRALISTGIVLLCVTSCSKNALKNTADQSNFTNTNDTNTSLLSAAGDVVGKVTVGYQGWFSAAGDGSPINAWAHQNLENWPDVRQYTTTYSGDTFNQAGVVQPPFTGNLGNQLLQ